VGIYNKFLDFIGIEEAEDKQQDNNDLFEEDVAPEKETSPRRRPLLEPEPKKIRPGTPAPGRRGDRAHAQRGGHEDDRLSSRQL